MSSDINGSSSIIARPLPILYSLRCFFLQLILKILFVGILMFFLIQQGGFLANGEFLYHPVERMIREIGLDVDVVVFSSFGEIDSDGQARLEELKTLARGVAQAIKDEDTPHNWEINSDVGSVYQFVSYQGRTAQGTHWVSTAYQIGTDPIQICLRKEERTLSRDFKHSLSVMEKYVANIVKGKVSSGVTVSGRTYNTILWHSKDFVKELINDFPLVLRRTDQSQTAQIAHLFSPFLVGGNHSSQTANLFIKTENLGGQQRITITTPSLQLGDSQDTSYSFWYTLENFEQTISEEVR